MQWAIFFWCPPPISDYYSISSHLLWGSQSFEGRDFQVRFSNVLLWISEMLLPAAIGSISDDNWTMHWS